MPLIIYQRNTIKNGVGKATIPPSPSHDLGDWIETDIYENEVYMDTSKKKMYTRIGNNIIPLNSAPSFPPAISFTGCIYAGPPTEDDGDIYILIKDVDSPFMDVDTIAWTVGNTVRYTFNEFSMMVDGSLGVNAYLHVNGAINPVHNGSFKITAFNTGAGWIEVTNSRVESAGSNEASDSPAEAYYTQADWDGGKLGDIMQYHLSSNLWEATTPTAGQTIVNKFDFLEYVFNGTDWVQIGIWAQDATNISTKNGRNVLPLASNAQDLGSATKLWKHIYVGGDILTETEFRISTERTSPNVDVNNNWNVDGSPFLGTWTALLFPAYGDLVESSINAGEIYQNQSGANGVDDPSIDGGNWYLYITGYVGPWNAGPFALNAVVDYGGFLYTHISDTQEMFKELYFDGTTFLFRTNISQFMKLDSSEMAIRRIADDGTGNLTAFASSALELIGQYIQMQGYYSVGIGAVNILKMGIGSQAEIFIRENSAGNVTSDSTDKKAIVIGAYEATVKQGVINSVTLGGTYPLADKNGSVVFGNFANADSGKLAYYAHTEDATPTDIQINNAYDFDIPVNTAYKIKIEGMCVNQVTGDCSTFSGEGLIKNIGGTTTFTALTILSQTFSEGTNLLTVLAVSADDTNDLLTVTVTGPTGDARWNVVIDYVRIKFA